MKFGKEPPAAAPQRKQPEYERDPAVLPVLGGIAAVVAGSIFLYINYPEGPFGKQPELPKQKAPAEPPATKELRPILKLRPGDPPTRIEFEQKFFMPGDIKDMPGTHNETIPPNFRTPGPRLGENIIIDESGNEIPIPEANKDRLIQPKMKPWKTSDNE